MKMNDGNLPNPGKLPFHVERKAERFVSRKNQTLAARRWPGKTGRAVRRQKGEEIQNSTRPV